MKGKIQKKRIDEEKKNKSMCSISGITAFISMKRISNQTYFNI